MKTNKRLDVSNLGFKLSQKVLNPKFQILNIFILALLIFGYISSAVAEEKKSFGKSIHSSKLYSQKLYQSRVKGTTNYDELLYKRGSDTLSGGTSTNYTSGSNLHAKPVPYKPGTVTYSPGTFTDRPWLGQSLYKRLKDKEYKHQYPEIEGERERYYSDIFYKKRNEQSEDKDKDKEVNPFLRR